jgi:glycerol kinase
MQFVADLLDVPVVRPMVTETVSLGAAYAAGLAVGYWPDLEVPSAGSARTRRTPDEGLPKPRSP